MKRIASLSLMIILVVGVLSSMYVVQPVKAEGTIYIRSDGSIDPPTAPISTVDNVTYMFTDNIYGSIVVERDNIVVNGSGYTLHGSGPETGMYLSSRNNVTITDTNITGFLDGIGLFFSFNNMILGNNIFGNSIWGIWIESSSNNTILGNNATGNGNGIVLKSSSNNIVSNNNATENNYAGMAVHDGISLIFSSGNRVSGNKIAGNERVGINLYSSSNNTILGNNATDDGSGIWLYSSSNNTISGNICAKSRGYGFGIGIYVSSGNMVYHNTFIDNFYQAGSDTGSVKAWDDGYPSGGNYWSDYGGADSDRDGIGDTPYVIDSNNVDNYPLFPLWIPADVNHDLNVNILDVVRITGAYGATPSNPNWDPYADIVQPYGKIDILDVVACTSHYGEKYP